MASKVESETTSSRYPEDWPERRRRILQRDDYTCQECDSTNGEALHVHHKTPLSKGGTHNPENLVTLCRDCHSEKHPNNSLLKSDDDQSSKKSIHHSFRKQLCEEYGISYETAKKYDHLHNVLRKEQSEFPFNF